MSLPSGYTELAYLKSTGTQYCNIGIKPDQNTRVVCRFRTTAASTSLYGAQAAWGSNSFSFGGNTVSFGANSSTSLALNDGVLHTSDFNCGKLYVDGTLVLSFSGTFTVPYNMYVFANNEKDTTVYYSEAEIYELQVYQGNTLVRDLLPCATGSGELGLWDDANSVFYGNAGSGSFVSPLTPVGDHNTNIGGVAREIEGMAVRMGGVLREIDRGTMLANGVAREITFVPSSYTITTGEALSTGYTKYSTSLNGATLADNSVYTVEPGTQIMISVQTSQYITIYVRVNGSTVATASPNSSKTYTYTVNSDITINCTTNSTLVYYDITTS